VSDLKDLVSGLGTGVGSQIERHYLIQRRFILSFVK